jgi:polar amino acid transport system substrate-binding protein
LANDDSLRPFIIVAEQFPPFEYLDSDGVPAGINVEIIKHIFTELGVPYEIRFYPWARAWVMVENGAADAILSVSYNPKREPFIYFTEEQRQFISTGVIPPDFLWLTEYVFFVNRRLANTVRFESYEQVKRDGLRVVVSDQYSYDEAFLHADLDSISKSSPSDAMRAIVDGIADLYPMDRTGGWALIKQEGLAEKITWLPKPLFSKPYLFGVSKVSGFPGAQEIMRKFYDKLLVYRRHGDIDQITLKNLKGVRLERPSRPLVFVCEDWPPFEYMKDGQMQGIDVELVTRIMKAMGLQYEIRSYPWPRAWMMAERGQAEAVLSVSYHPDREKVLYYTDGQRYAFEKGGLPQDYLWLSRYRFFVKSQNDALKNNHSYDQLIEAKTRIGLNKGYSYAPGFPVDKFNSTYYFDTEAGFMGLIKDEIDLYPMDMTVGQHTLLEMGLEKSVESLSQDLFSKAYLCPFVKASDYPGLESIMYEFYYNLRQLRASGLLPY